VLDIFPKGWLRQTTCPPLADNTPLAVFSSYLNIRIFFAFDFYFFFNNVAKENQVIRINPN